MRHSSDKIASETFVQHTLILHRCGQNLSQKLLRDNGRGKTAAEIELFAAGDVSSGETSVRLSDRNSILMT